MRLDKKQSEALKEAVQAVTGEVFLFGSRVDDDKKGGDVDILIFSKEDSYRLSQEVAAKYMLACDEKIDVVVMDPDNLTEEKGDGHFQKALKVSVTFLALAIAKIRAKMAMRFYLFLIFKAEVWRTT